VPEGELVKSKSRDPIMRGALPALRRAARAAWKLAVELNTPFYVVKDGKIVNLNPNAKRRRAAKRPRGRGARATGKKQRDDDLMRGSMAALRRASRAAWKLARETNTPFHVWKNGRIVNLNPSAKNRKRKLAPAKRLWPAHLALC
jgi:hypothetical protein